jgi:hypothetical protein
LEPLITKVTLTLREKEDKPLFHKMSGLKKYKKVI